MSIRKTVGGFLALALLVAGGFFVGRLLTNGGGTEAQSPSVVQRLDDLETIRDAEEAEPRFVGERLGIYLAPTLDGIPPDLLAENERMQAAGCVVIDVRDAGDLDFPRQLEMPEGYTLAPPDIEGSNPWTRRCGGQTGWVGRRYIATGEQGIFANVIIVRSRLRYDTQDIAASRVSTQVIGGREAVVIAPLSAGGFAERSLVYFPEVFGKTAIHAFNLSGPEMLKVAEAVAEASR